MTVKERVRVGGENPKNAYGNDVVKAAVERKELGARNEVANDVSLQRRKEKFKGCIYQSKKDMMEQFERKLNQDIDVNRKLFKKGVSEVSRGKLESFSIIKDGDERLALRKDEL